MVGQLQGSRGQAKTREENDLPMSNTPTIAVAELVAPLRKGERRRKRRAGVSLALRVRPADAKDGTQFRVTVPYRPSAGIGSWENRAEVMRVEEPADSRTGLAIRLLGAASHPA